MTNARPRRRLRLGSLIAAAVAGVLATGLIGSSWEEMSDRLPVGLPTASGLGGLLLAALVGFVLVMIEEIEKHWAKRVVRRLDPIRLWRRRRRLRRYADHLIDHASEVQIYGAGTRGAHAMRLPELHVGPALDRPGSSRRQSLPRMIERDERQAFIVVGEPGSGKTTLLRHTAMELCRDRRRLRRRPPVLFYLRDHVDGILTDPAATTLETLVDESPALRHDAIADTVRDALRQDRCVVLLDGLDEVAGGEKRQEVARWIKAQMECHPRSDFIITARRQGYRNTVLADLDTLEVRPFDWDQISRFVRQWYRAAHRLDDDRADPDRSDRESARMLKLLRDTPQLGDLVANPLLLIMACNVHHHRGHLFGNRAELYHEMCAMLVDQRKQSAGVRSRFDPLTGRQKLLPLRGLAVDMMKRRVRRVGAAEAIALFARQLRQMPRRVDPEDYLIQAVENGILREDGPNAYCFMHATVQEYLAAVSLRENGEDAFLAERVDQPWWRETILLWAAEGDASTVIRECLRIRDAESLVLAQQCLDVAREVEPGIATAVQTLLDDADRELVADSLLRGHFASAFDLGDDARLAVEPLPYRVWAWFLVDLRFNDCLDPPGRLYTGEAAAGMWPIYVDRFLLWANHHAPPDRHYRLPLAAELDEYLARLPPRAVATPLWVHDEGRPRLYCPDGVRNGYEVDRETVVQALRADRARTLGHRLAAVAVHTAMRRGTASVSNPLVFTTAFGWARAIDSGAPTRAILERAFDQLLKQVIAVAEMTGWRPRFDWDAYVAELQATDFARSLAERGDLPRQLREPDVIAVRAALVLASVWTMEVAGDPSARSSFAESTNRLDDLSAPADGLGPVYPETIIGEVRAAADLIEHQGATSIDERFTPLPERTGRLLSDAADLLEPILQRQRKFDVHTVVCARSALVAGIGVAAIATGQKRAVERLRRAVAGLVAIETRIDEETAPDDRLVLVSAPVDRVARVTEPPRLEPMSHSRPSVFARLLAGARRASERLWPVPVRIRGPRDPS